MLKLNDDGVAARTAQAAAAATAQMARVRALESSLSLLRSETAMLTQPAQAEVTAAQPSSTAWVWSRSRARWNATRQAPS